MQWTDGIPLWDHHCHTVVGPDAFADMEGFARALTEAPKGYPLSDIENTVIYWRALQVAAGRLQVAPTSSDVGGALNATDYATYCRTLFHDAGYAGLMVDTGYAPPGGLTPEALSTILKIPVARILRLETLAESLAAPDVSFDDWMERVSAALARARRDGYIGVKSIVAYRSGLEIRPETRTDAEAAYRRLVAGGRIRLQEAVLLNFLLWTVTPVIIGQALPIQFHTGYGDPDTDLRRGNPLHLRAYLETFGPRGLRVALLHTYPYHREAGYLASVYPGVAFDVSLAVPLAATGARRIVQEALELAPVSRFLFASDAHSRPESFVVAAHLWRTGLDAFLTEAVHEHHVPPAVAERWARDVLGENARRWYGLTPGASGQ